ncbi:MAG TPA: SRPBCC family protein [Gammaproteobacteria bacterium]
MFRIIATAVLALVAAWLVYATTRPDTFRFERSTLIQAPASEVFPHVSDFRKWRAWSPWEELDPALKRNYSGAARGEGAVYAWKGNRNVGTGRMEIIDAARNARLAISLDFLEPFESRQFTEFMFVADAGATRVTWVMHGSTPFIWKLLGPFVDFDDVIGTSLETGLANLKQAVEDGLPPGTPSPAETGQLKADRRSL